MTTNSELGAIIPYIYVRKKHIETTTQFYTQNMST